MPSNTASFVLSEFRSHGRVRRAWLGIAGEEVLVPGPVAQREGLAAPRGVLVRGVEPESPAARAGLRPGDILVALGGKPVASVADLHRALSSDAIGTEHTVGILRSGSRMLVRVRPNEARPAAR